MSIDQENKCRAIEELKAGKRVWTLLGLYQMSDGFTIFPTRIDLLHLLMDEDKVSQIITQEEAVELSKNEYCTNKGTAQATLQEIGAMQ